MFFPDWSGRGRARLGVLCILAFCLLLAGGCGSKQKKGQPLSMPSLIIPGDEGGEPLTPTELAAFQNTARIDRDIHKASMPDVVLQYKHFLRKGRGTMSVFSRNAEPYLGYARKVFRSRGMPEELAYLALVESGYRPDAESRVGALGAWQFMPYTGMKYGLTQDWWLDERLDPYRATEAAADYLQKLYGDFRDWPTAIAAYNAGEGKMSRAKEGTGARNFYEVVERNHKLDEKARLRPETVQYVPRFLAMSKIMRNLPQLGFTPVDQDKPAPVRRLTARPGTDLIALSRACGLSWESFQGYNLHHKRTISSTERSTFVYVPVQNEAQAQAFLRSSSASAFANWRPTKVQTSSDSLARISKRSGVPLERIQAANPEKKKIYAGDTLLLPRGVPMSPSAVAAADGKPSRKERSSDRGRQERNRPEPSGGVYVLRPNDTLYGVARQFGVSVSDLQACNNIDDPSQLQVGQRLTIPGKGGAAASRPSSSGRQTSPKGKASRASRTKTYTIQAGDSLWGIARKNDVSVEDIKRWNDGVDAQNLHVGSTLIVGD